MAADSLADLVKGFSRGGRALLQKYAPFVEWERVRKSPPARRIEALCDALLSVKGEASGGAIAADLLDAYRGLDAEERLGFFRYLAERHGPDSDRIGAAYRAYEAGPSPATLQVLTRSVEAPRRELFRRLNMPAGATSHLVEMRRHLLDLLRPHPELVSVEDDLRALLESWFNRGFLELRHLSWSSPADILERIIRYEAVHTIHDWADLRSRLDPPDRRCFAFFHPAMPDEPLIFVEVALMPDIPAHIDGILTRNRLPDDLANARYAVFYSISNCQAGLQGISFGNFLIKQVAADLSRDLPQIQGFVTLSPVPGLMDHLRKAAADPDGPALTAEELARLAEPGWWDDAALATRFEAIVLPEAVRYFLDAKRRDGKPLDPVARFHLGNGARLERLNWLADRSTKGLEQSGGVMVNYLYDLPSVEENHEAYANQNRVRVGKPFQLLADRSKAAAGKARSSRK
ncbi:malonyl-CoA decarboxylase [Flavisphingomonas formosensis]|uniref:malonyl-CoA decarboxylase n=1 Tax=Flavisphingomonas formosensis TaxID=861534 RepID=UPI0012FB2F06|nr:malonyl-CoA decarboxylase [Sphingomonas formosensis]